MGGSHVLHFSIGNEEIADLFWDIELRRNSARIRFIVFF